MKQTEKLDLLLRELYKYKFDGNAHSLMQICKENCIQIEPNNEVRLLAHRLVDDGFITGHFTFDDCLAEITSYGIEYCEDDSYTYRGSSLIANNYISISNSPNSNIVSESKNVTINITNYSSIKGKISELKDAINSTILDDEIRTDLLDCLEEIETSIDAGKKPKFSMKQLMEIGANVSGITSLIIELSQLL